MLVKLDDNDVEMYQSSPLATLMDLFPSLKHKQLLVTLCGNIKVWLSLKLWEYDRTDSDNPLIIKSHVKVWVKRKGGQPILEEHSLNVTVKTIIGSNYFAHQSTTVLGNDKLLVTLKTKFENLLLLKKRSCTLSNVNSWR